MWRHIDVQADWRRRSWTYARAPNAIDISCTLAIFIWYFLIKFTLHTSHITRASISKILSFTDYLWEGDWLISATYNDISLIYVTETYVQADWRSWTYGRAPNAIAPFFTVIPRKRPFSRLLWHTGDTEDLFSSNTPNPPPPLPLCWYQYTYEIKLVTHFAYDSTQNSSSVMGSIKRSLWLPRKVLFNAEQKWNQAHATLKTGA